VPQQTGCFWQKKQTPYEFGFPAHGCRQSQSDSSDPNFPGFIAQMLFFSGFFPSLTREASLKQGERV